MTISLNQLWGPTRRTGEPLSAPIVFFDDFIGFSFCADAALLTESDPAADFSTVADRGTWLVSQDTVGDTGSIFPVDSADGGFLTMQSTATGSHRVNCQVNGTMFRLQVGRKMVFECRWKVNSITVGQFFVGIATQTVQGFKDIDNAITPFRYIGFSKSSDADIEYALADTDEDNRVDTGVNFVADTFVTTSWEWDGQDTIRFYVDGVLKKIATDQTAIDEYYSPLLVVDNLTAAANTLTVDYILVMNDRATA